MNRGPAAIPQASRALAIFGLAAEDALRAPAQGVVLESVIDVPPFVSVLRQARWIRERHGEVGVSESRLAGQGCRQTGGQPLVRVFPWPSVPRNCRGSGLGP